jgi:lytic cellulose monooxygenase (C1-hydroxylating)
MTCNFDGSATKDSLHGTATAGSMITAQFNALNFTLTTVGETIVITQLHL